LAACRFRASPTAGTDANPRRRPASRAAPQPAQTCSSVAAQPAHARSPLPTERAGAPGPSTRDAAATESPVCSTARVKHKGHHDELTTSTCAPDPIPRRRARARAVPARLLPQRQ
jgi:hypothetical protein